eukprot:4046836-Amphidinium_carterae.2
MVSCSKRGLSAIIEVRIILTMESQVGGRLAKATKARAASKHLDLSAGSWLTSPGELLSTELPMVRTWNEHSQLCQTNCPEHLAPPLTWILTWPL